MQPQPALPIPGSGLQRSNTKDGQPASPSASTHLPTYLPLLYTMSTSIRYKSKLLKTGEERAGDPGERGHYIIPHLTCLFPFSPLLLLLLLDPVRPPGTPIDEKEVRIPRGVHCQHTQRHRRVPSQRERERHSGQWGLCHQGGWQHIHCTQHCQHMSHHPRRQYSTGFKRSSAKYTLHDTEELGCVEYIRYRIIGNIKQNVQNI